MHTKSTFTLLTGTLLLLGCHSPAPPSAAPTPAAVPVTDACAVLTPAEISAVIGVPIDPGNHNVASSIIMCSWSMTGATGETAVKVVLNFTKLDYFQKEKTPTNPRVTVAPTTGIGDEAYYVTTEFGTSLFIRKGNTAIGFSIHDKTLPANQLLAKEKALGLKAAARL
jgi:hypothetical protein